MLDVVQIFCMILVVFFQILFKDNNSEKRLLWTCTIRSIYSAWLKLFGFNLSANVQIPAVNNFTRFSKNVRNRFPSVWVRMHVSCWHSKNGLREMRARPQSTPTYEFHEYSNNVCWWWWIGPFFWCAELEELAEGNVNAIHQDKYSRHKNERPAKLSGPKRISSMAIYSFISILNTTKYSYASATHILYSIKYH